MIPIYRRNNTYYSNFQAALRAAPPEWTPTIEYGRGRSKAITDRLYREWSAGRAPERPTVEKGTVAVYPPVPEVSRKPANIHSLLADWVVLFEEWWRPEKRHLIPHSTGMDSRLCSATLRYLADRHGDDWLGDVLFITWAPEGELTAPILADVGFADEHLILVPDTGPDTYARFLDPGFIARNAGEPDRLFCGLSHLHEKILGEPHEWQVLSGGYVHPEAIYRRYKGDIARYYTVFASGFQDPFWGTDVMYPWNDPRIMAYGKSQWDRDPRPEMVEMLVPGYSRHENYSPQRRHPNPCYDLAPATLNRLQSWYNEVSQRHNLPAVTLTDNFIPGGYPECWAWYMLACLMEEYG